jgi:hypothetical protein
MLALTVHALHHFPHRLVVAGHRPFAVVRGHVTRGRHLSHRVAGGKDEAKGG